VAVVVGGDDCAGGIELFDDLRIPREVVVIHHEVADEHTLIRKFLGFAQIKSLILKPLRLGAFVRAPLLPAPQNKYLFFKEQCFHFAAISANRNPGIHPKSLRSQIGQMYYVN